MRAAKFGYYVKYHRSVSLELYDLRANVEGLCAVVRQQVISLNYAFRLIAGLGCRQPGAGAAQFHSNWMRTISGFDPSRIGGPHVPAPHEV
jgi:hypothetical protein